MRALKQIHDQVRLKIAEEERALLKLGKRNQSSESDSASVSEALLDVKDHSEARLSAFRSDENAIKEELANLAVARDYPPSQTDDGDLRQTKESRVITNLNLFLQKSPTKRPLLPYTSFSLCQSWRVASGRVRKSDPELQRSRKRPLHSHAKSITGDAHYHRGGEYLETPGWTTTLSSDSNRRLDHGVLAVDEFRNSFSSRVILPFQAYKRPSNSLRDLLLSVRQPIIDRRFRSLAAPAGKTEFGSITILPQERPRRTSEFSDALQGVELPSYVKNLMEEFEEKGKPSTSLTFSDYRLSIPVPSREKEISPLLTSPSSTSPLSTERSSPSPTKFTTPKFSRKQKSLFTLHLPKRSEPASTSRSTLVGSPTTSVSDCTIEVTVPARALPKAPNRRKGLPSTRLYDLSQLDKAPDDIPCTPTVSEAGFMSPLTPRKSRLAAPLSALRGVGSRLLQLHRR